jgi:predicted nucleotidyltransferase component of viral defense system
VLPQVEQSYFRFLPFAPANIRCLALPEILAETIRACYQRNKAQDIYDLGMFATRSSFCGIGHEVKNCCVHRWRTTV